jgi:glyoxylase-like metal-dependent hydrolase (beta-lactamase superfamily II)
MLRDASLRYPFNNPPATGASVEIAPGILWMRMPLPFSLNHINVWAIADGAGWTLVDTGIRSPETVEAWQHLHVHALAKAPVTRVLITHMHPDHVGMAGWLTRHFNAPLWMTRLEYLTCRILVADTGREAPEDGVRFYVRAGWSPAQIEVYRARFGEFGKHCYALPDSYRRIADGDALAMGPHAWQVLIGNGHSPEHACLYCPARALLIAGDQVLPTISSNVSVFPTEPDADPLRDWLASLQKLAQHVPDDTLILPSHGLPFYGLHHRLNQLTSSHMQALERLWHALATPARVVDVFKTLFSRPIDDPQTLSMATGESLAHLNRLLATGAARVEEDAQGVAWYSQGTALLV